MCKHLCCEHTAVSILPGWQENMPALNENQSLLNLFAPARLDWRCFRAHKELCLGRRIIFRQGVTYSALEDVRSTRNANCIWGTQIHVRGRHKLITSLTNPLEGYLSFWAEGLEKKACQENVFQGTRSIHLGAPSVLTSAFPTIQLSCLYRLILGLICFYLHHWRAGSCTNKG